MKVFSLLFLALVVVPALPFHEEDKSLAAFQALWKDKRVYLLIPRDQGRKRGFKKTTHLQFSTGQRDSYLRRATFENGEVGFCLYTVQSAKCTLENCRIKLSRPARPQEPVLGFTVSVVLDIRQGTIPISSQTATEILSTVVIEEHLFPRLLWIGEGPYQQFSPVINLSWVPDTQMIRPGMTEDELTSALGLPTDTKTAYFPGRVYQYHWYFGYRFFVVTRGEEVIDSTILYF